MSMKQAVLISLIFFGLFIVLMVSVRAGQLAAPMNTRIESVKPTNSASAGVIYSVTEVATHSSADDCWLLISNKVYNVTSFVTDHPGGARQIVDYCGKEATTAFETQGGEGSHSSTANAMLGTYLVGSVR